MTGQHLQRLCSQEAEAAERADPPMVNTCREIVRAVIDYGVEKDDWKKTWKADARVGTPSDSLLFYSACPVHLQPMAAACQTGARELAVQEASAA